MGPLSRVFSTDSTYLCKTRTTHKRYEQRVSAEPRRKPFAYYGLKERSSRYTP